jgi:antitoxin (DNA-binding transcriptional repressor) of toxin-antitoxin stability system
MRTVNLDEAKLLRARLLAEAETGAEVTIARDGVPVAKLDAAPRKVLPRIPGQLRGYPGWENFEYNDSLFAPMTEEEMKAEGWSTY